MTIKFFYAILIKAESTNIKNFLGIKELRIKMMFMADSITQHYYFI